VDWLRLPPTGGPDARQMCSGMGCFELFAPLGLARTQLVAAVWSDVDPPMKRDWVLRRPALDSRISVG